MDPNSEKQQSIRVRKKRICELRIAGLSTIQIAAKLDVSFSTVEQVSSSLAKEGKIPHRRRGPSKSSATYGLENERTQTVIRLKKNHATLAEIGVALGGVTKQYVQALIRNIALEHGWEVFAADEPVWTTTEAAKKMGVSYTQVFAACKKGIIPCKKRGTNYVLTSESMKALRCRFKKVEVLCKNCGKPFWKLLSVRKATCGPKCCYEYWASKRKEFNKERYSKSADAYLLRGWMLELSKRLAFHALPENEGWISASQACRMAGLSKMQLYNLGKRQLVLTRSHSVKKHPVTGAPLILYAASQMAIAGQVYRDHIAKKEAD